MQRRDKFRLRKLLVIRKEYRLYGCMRSTVRFIGDIESPTWDEPWDAELGIAYRGESGVPVHYTGNGIQTTDDL